MEKDRLVEDNDRKIRDTTHKVGLLKTQQEHEVANARRETELEVREGALKAKEDQFKSEMAFQREHMDRENAGIKDILGKILERLPTIEVDLSGQARTGSRKATD